MKLTLLPIDQAALFLLWLIQTTVFFLCVRRHIIRSTTLEDQNIALRDQLDETEFVAEEQTRICPTCKGEGKVESYARSNYWVDCSRCEGAGTIEISVLVPRKEGYITPEKISNQSFDLPSQAPSLGRAWFIKGTTGTVTMTMGPTPEEKAQADVDELMNRWEACGHIAPKGYEESYYKARLRHYRGLA